MKRLTAPAAKPGRTGLRQAAWIAIAVVLTAVLASNALAQEAGEKETIDLVGVVVDGSGRPLVGAFVALEGSEWGSLTNEKGRFVLPKVTPGPVGLSVELLGYETRHWNGTARDGVPVSLTLAEEPILLEGLHVVADRFESRRRATATTVRWYDREALSTSAQTNALDFLLTRAGLFRVTCNSPWSSECLRVRGRITSPTVWVDEFPILGGLDYLKLIPPHELYMVEVYGSGRHIRAYTNHFMARAAEKRIHPMALLF